jgi:hypothetical protein
MNLRPARPDIHCVRFALSLALFLRQFEAGRDKCTSDTYSNETECLRQRIFDGNTLMVPLDAHSVELAKAGFTKSRTARETCQEVWEYF